MSKENDERITVVNLEGEWSTLGTDALMLIKAIPRVRWQAWYERFQELNDPTPVHEMFVDTVGKLLRKEPVKELPVLCVAWLVEMYKDMGITGKLPDYKGKVDMRIDEVNEEEFKKMMEDTGNKQLSKHEFEEILRSSPHAVRMPSSNTVH